MKFAKVVVKVQKVVLFEQQDREAYLKDTEKVHHETYMNGGITMNRLGVRYYRDDSKKTYFFMAHKTTSLPRYIKQQAQAELQAFRESYAQELANKHL